MANNKIWIVPQTEEFIRGKDTVSNDELYKWLFTKLAWIGSKGRVNPTQNKRLTAISVLEKNGFYPTLHQYPATDKRQVWKRAKDGDDGKAGQMINQEKAKQFLESHNQFEIKDFVEAAIGVSSVLILRRAGSYLRELNYAPRQRRIGTKRVSLWANNWED